MRRKRLCKIEEQQPEIIQWEDWLTLYSHESTWLKFYNIPVVIPKITQSFFDSGKAWLVVEPVNMNYGPHLEVEVINCDFSRAERWLQYVWDTYYPSDFKHSYQFAQHPIERENHSVILQIRRALYRCRPFS